MFMIDLPIIMLMIDCCLFCSHLDLEIKLIDIYHTYISYFMYFCVILLFATLSFNFFLIVLIL